MRIKSLSIRNIASIESADIDFENGLNDAFTNEPSNIFLISGDTGAGKSVILDAISMALYKNTPRINDSANKTNNSYTNAEGEEIKINSIEQYTRLGISPNDECYSEVVFEGNDNVEYRAKLSLGLKLGNTDRKTGKRHIKHRDTIWTVKVGNEDWVKVGQKEDNQILKAIGLSFEQFGRMAMLAQGQFAAFLTGDKKERESILEQLTNTAHFSDYGNAIKSLFDKAKTANSNAQHTYDAEQGHVLEEDVVKELVDKHSECQNDIDKLNVKANKTNEVLQNIESVENAKKDKATAESNINNLEKQFDTLYADIMSKQIENEKHAQELNDEGENGQGLKAEVEKVRKASEEANKNVDDAQKIIDNLTEEQKKLNPTEVNGKISKNNNKKTSLCTLSTMLDTLKGCEDKITEKEKEIEKEKGNLQTLLTNKETADQEFNAANANADKAKNLLLTMKSSVSDMLINLRKKLYDEHTETCPLCGQEIKKLKLDKDFEKLITPLQEEQKKANKILKDATAKRENANKDYDTANGKLLSSQTQLKKDIKAKDNLKAEINKSANNLGLDTNLPLEGQIDTAKTELDNELVSLKDLQNKITELQNKIANCIKAKKPLDNEKAKADRKLTEKSEELNNAIQELKNKEGVVNELLGMHKEVLELHPEWKKEVEAAPFACKDIKKEWRNFIIKCNSEKTNLENATSLITSSLEEISLFYKNEDREDELSYPISEQKNKLDAEKEMLNESIRELVRTQGEIKAKLDENDANKKKFENAKNELDRARKNFNKWDQLNNVFGGTRFRTLVQTYILRPLLNNANTYLEQITDRYMLTCSEDNEQLAILVHDRYNKDQVRSVTVLSGGERFMISLALSLALSSLNRPDMNVNILFIDEGFGTLDEKNLDSVMSTLEKLQEIAGQTNRRVGIISHREELIERIPTQIVVKKKGEGRSTVVISNNVGI